MLSSVFSFQPLPSFTSGHLTEIKSTHPYKLYAITAYNADLVATIKSIENLGVVFVYIELDVFSAYASSENDSFLVWDDSKNE